MIGSSLLLKPPPDCMKRRETTALQSEHVANMIESLANGVASWSRYCYLLSMLLLTPVGSLCSSFMFLFFVPRAFFRRRVGGKWKFEEGPRQPMTHDPQIENM